MARITALSYVLPVRDLDEAARFYKAAFGLEEVFRGDRIVFVGIAGTESAVGLLLDPANAGAGPQNIGLHVAHDVGLDAAIRDVEAAGGRIIERSEHAPGVPFARMADPDGNVLEI
jgi:catechol 2,3-dioxygenase-like lactoylglutathione lyase family enzyme